MRLPLDRIDGKRTGGSLKAAGFGDGRERRDLAGGDVDSTRSLSVSAEKDSEPKKNGVLIFDFDI